MHTQEELAKNSAGALPGIVFTGCEVLAAAPAQMLTRTSAPAKAPEAAYDCKASKSNVPTCKRQVSQDARMQCRWRCKLECSGRQCIEICRGSGQECNGKTPPGW
mgnify:CR=1 FL=1